MTGQAEETQSQSKSFIINSQYSLENQVLYQAAGFIKTLFTWHTSLERSRSLLQDVKPRTTTTKPEPLGTHVDVYVCKELLQKRFRILYAFQKYLSIMLTIRSWLLKKPQPTLLLARQSALKEIFCLCSPHLSPMDGQVLGRAGVPPGCPWNAFHSWMLRISVVEPKAGLVAALPTRRDWRCRRGLDGTSAERSAGVQGHTRPALEARHFWELSNRHASKVGGIS